MLTQTRRAWKIHISFKFVCEHTCWNSAISDCRIVGDKKGVMIGRTSWVKFLVMKLPKNHFLHKRRPPDLLQLPQPQQKRRKLTRLTLLMQMGMRWMTKNDDDKMWERDYDLYSTQNITGENWWRRVMQWYDRCLIKISCGKLWLEAEMHAM